MENLDFSIVLPAYNESESLPDLLRGLKKVLNEANIKSEIIVVDDGSTDDTGEVLELLKGEINELRTLKIKKNTGFGNGAIKGLEMARGPILGYMVADGQIKPEAVVSVYQKLKENNLDFCKGFRINRRDGLVRIVISKIFNFLFRLMFNCPLGDVGGGPKIFTRNFYETVRLQSKDFFIEAEILIKARHNNFLVGGVPVVSPGREKGRSSVSILTLVEYLKNMSYWFFLKKF